MVWRFEVTYGSETKTSLCGGRGVCLSHHSPCSSSCRCGRNISADRTGGERMDSRHHAGSLLPVLRSGPPGLRLGSAATASGTLLQRLVPQLDQEAAGHL